jgi:poly-gamma-glutamate synthesis protein (capsule biosynthesis protein)
MNKKVIKLIFMIFILMILSSILIFVDMNDDSDLLASMGAFGSDGPKENLSIAITGDVMFARKMPGVLDAVSSPFKEVANVTGSADILLINFENPATFSSTAFKGVVPLKADPRYTHLAKANKETDGSITIAGLANNHIFDYGEEGLKDTLAALKDNGIIAIGAGNNADEAFKPAIADIKGRKVAVFNYMDQNNFKEYSQSEMPIATDSKPGYASIDWDRIPKDIAAVKNDSGDSADMVIAYVHFGNEYSRSPNKDQVEISKKFIDNGVDVVVGTHPHVTQGIDMYKGKPIFYSLGNFIFDQSNPNTHRAMFLELDLIENNCEVTVHPIYINNYIPEFMGSNSGTELLKELSPQLDSLNITDEGKGKLSFELDS